VPALRKDTISVEFTIVPLRENGRLIAIAAIMRDVSKRFDLRKPALSSASLPN
jgi:hypothetical protein